MSQTRSLVKWGQWPPYLFWPSDPQHGRALPELVEGRPAEGLGWDEALSSGQIEPMATWPVEIVLKNFLVIIADRMLRQHRRRENISFSEVEDWIASTRSVARRLPYGGGAVPQQLEEAAARVEGLHRWPEKFFAPVPRGPGRRQSLQINMCAWALREFLRAFNHLEQFQAERLRATFRLDFQIPGFWEDKLAPLLPDDFPTSTFDDHSMESRMDRLAAKITPGLEIALMAEILRDLLHYGPFLSNDTVRSDLRLID